MVVRLIARLAGRLWSQLPASVAFLEFRSKIFFSFIFIFPPFQGFNYDCIIYSLLCRIEAEAHVTN